VSGGECLGGDLAFAGDDGRDDAAGYDVWL
jgi:hypothetical protein